MNIFYFKTKMEEKVLLIKKLYNNGIITVVIFQVIELAVDCEQQNNFKPILQLGDIGIVNNVLYVLNARQMNTCHWKHKLYSDLTPEEKNYFVIDRAIQNEVDKRKLGK